MTKDKNNITKLERREPPADSVKSVQFDLFKSFVTNDESKVSNSVEIWESIPKYCFTHEQIKKLRTPDGLAKPYKFPYEREGQQLIMEVQPALIEDEEGNYKAYFPSYTEELVEEALKKFLTIQNMGIHDPAKHETWVRFTLSMISKELRNTGNGRDRAKIKHALQVMSRSVITLYRGKKEIWSGTILQDLVTVDRDEYIEDSNAYHIARLPLFVSHAIDGLQGRQFNYERLMQCKGQLSRHIYKRLIHRFKQASYTDLYHFMYSDLVHSGLLQSGRERDSRKKVLDALKELIEQGVLTSFEAQDRKNGRAIVDVKYIVYPSYEFITEQKAANKRARDNYQKALHAGYVPSVDKLPD